MPLLIHQPVLDHTPRPLDPQEKKKLDEFYARYSVLDKGPEEKIQALHKVIQARDFFAFGGGETREMELRANERIFLDEYAHKL